MDVSKTKSSFYRRLYVARLVSVMDVLKGSGFSSVSIATRKL